MSVALYAEVVDLKPLRTTQVVKVTIELPIEHFVRVAPFLGARVLVTRAPEEFDSVPYGVVDSK